MKVKNLNFAEKYLEKIVLAVALLFACGVIWLKFLGAPYAVEMQGRDMAPAEVEASIADAAERLDNKIQETDPGFAKPNIPNYAQNFLDWQSRSVAVGPFPLPLGGQTLPWDRDREDRTPWYYVPNVPQPQGPRLAQGFGVLAEQRDLTMGQQFGQLIGTHRPWDFRWISVSATFDMEQWRQRLEQDPREPGFQKIPEEWWRNTLAIADVILERQEWDPTLPGEDKWAEPVRLAPLPNNQLSWRNPPMNWGRVEARQVAQQINENQRDITKPPFPSLTEGIWVRPDVNFDQLSQEQKQRYRQLDQQIKDIQSRITELMTKQAEEGAVGAMPRRGAAAAAGGPIRRIEERGAADGPAIPGQPTMAGAVGGGAAETVESLRDYLRQLQNEQEIVAGVAAGAGFGNVGAGDFAGAQQRLTVWGHDVTVEPGKYYRYRVIVAVINPLFQQTGVPPEQQKQAFNQLSITSLASEWSDPQQVQPDLLFFYVNADRQANSAAVEIYTIFNGKRVMKQFEPAPGDPVGGPVMLRDGVWEAARDLFTGSVLLDIDFDAPSRRGLFQTSPRVISLDQPSGQLYERSVEEDSDNMHRLQMRNEAANRPVASQ